ncbi:MAG: serine hydrolase, partial [Kordiimonadaceae bacterium]|nr:serine hydrolase [Kordiimonadaceae bacterium]
MSYKTGIKIVVAGALAYGVYAGVTFGHGIYQMMNFYDPEQITDNFRTAPDNIGYRVIEPAEPWTFDRAETEITLPETFIYEGEERSLANLIERSGTTGFLVIKDDKILFEKYYQGETETDLHAMFSVTKSFVSALFGMVVEEGLIESIEDVLEHSEDESMFLTTIPNPFNTDPKYFRFDQ